MTLSGALWSDLLFGCRMVSTQAAPSLQSGSGSISPGRFFVAARVNQLMESEPQVADEVTGFQVGLDRAKEAGDLGAVDGTMVVGERQVRYVPDNNGVTT